MPVKRMNKSQFLTALAEKSGLNRKQASAALDTINAMVAQQLGKRGPGEILIPGLLKLNVVTKEPMTYKAKAASKVISARPLKALKDAI